LDELRSRLAALGEPAYRARQLQHQLYQRQVESIEQMAELPVALRTRLAREYLVSGLELATTSRSDDGQTTKLLLRAADGNLLETVSIRESAANASQPRHTVCVSSQVGCAMGCQFCASGLDGVVRHLTSGEMIDQVLHVVRSCGPITNVVFMGMGEPLANVRQLIATLSLLCDPHAFGLGARRITVSTVGVVPGIQELAKLGLPVGLAVSLHAADEALRSRLVPATQRWSLAQVLDAARDYASASGRTVTYEYVLLADVNDGNRHADQLAALLGQRQAKINLIPYNPVPELQQFQRPTPPRVAEFRRRLVAAGVRATVRKAKGDEVAAACGQLRRHSQRLSPGL
jgi:23S rRNA (adenine2503-C2)-methyltransferase